MRRTLLGSLVVTLASFSALANRALADSDFEFRDIRVDREASADSALQKVRHAALTRAIEAFLGTRSGKVEDEQLERKMLNLAKARGEQLVELTVTEGPYRHESLGWVAKADAKVSRTGLEKLRAELTTGGKPGASDAPPLRVMVLISERVEYVNHGGGPIPIRDDEIGSIIGDRISQYLGNRGYEVVDAQQFEFLKQKRLDYSNLRKDDLEQVLAIAKDQGAEVLVLGRADVTGPRLEMIGGQQWYEWACMPKIHAVWQDNAVQIAVPCEREKGASNIAGPDGARIAMAKVSQKYAEQIGDALIRRTADNMSRALEIRIHGLAAKDSRAVDSLMRELGKPAPSRTEGGAYTLRLKTEMDVTAVAERLEDLKLPTGSKLRQDSRTEATLVMKVE